MGLLVAFPLLHLAGGEIFKEIRPTPDKTGQRPALASVCLRVLKSAFQNEPCDRIQVRGGDIAPKAHCLQWNRASAGKWIQCPRSYTTVESEDLPPQFIK